MSRFSLKLSDTREVDIFGEGGRTVDKAIRFYLDAIRCTAPNVAILELGSNDVCDRDSNTDAITSVLAALAELLVILCNIQFIVVCKKRPAFKHYNHRVRMINKLLSEASLPVTRASFWSHRGLIKPTADVYLGDSIDLNVLGYRALYKSYLGAILFALTRLQSCKQLYKCQ